MRLKRLHLAIVWTAVALFGALWAVCAQESPPWPTTVLPRETKVVGKAAPKYPYQTQPLEKKAKADPTLIIPSEVYAVPRLIHPNIPPLEIKPEVVQTGSQLPPLIVPGVQKTTGAVAPLPPIIEMKLPVAPLPMPDAIKVLLIDVETPEVPKKAPALQVQPPPLPISTQLVVPPTQQETVVSPPLTVINPSAHEKPKSFVRIRFGTLEAVPIMPPPVREPIPESLPHGLAPLPLIPAPTPNSAALLNLQTPAVVVEKRGPSSLRAGETQLYQIVIRNLGAIPARQIRLEDEIPADVHLLTADPMPLMQGTKATWTLPTLPAGGEQSLCLTLKADAHVQLASNTSVHVSAAGITTHAANAPSALSIRLDGPERVSVGKPAIFDIHVTNPSRQPLTGIVLYGELPEGLTTPVGNKIEGEVNGSIAPGDFKILKMPTTAVKPGRYTVQVKIVTQTGEASATGTIDIAAESLFLQQAPTTRLVLGRDGDLCIELANHTGKPLTNVTVANFLPAGFVFIGASDRGLFQANSRTVYWLIDNLPVGSAKTLVVRVNGSKAGQFPNLVSARADGVGEVRSTATLVLEGIADLTLRVKERDNPLELGRETVYEIQVQNPGSAAATNVQLQMQFPPGLMPTNAQGNTKFALDRQSVVFEPIPSLGPQGQVIFRVTALAQTVGNDQRVRFTLASEEVRTPLQREIGVMVYSGN